MAGMGATDTVGGITAAGAENTGFIILISCVATIGGFLFGFDSGVINGTVDGLQQAFQSTKAGLGFEVASMLLGCAIGAFFAGRLADRWGRRSVLIISAVLFLISALGSGAATSSAMFVAARVIGGFAVGAASVMSPAYIAEVASARYRGRLATVQLLSADVVRAPLLPVDGHLPVDRPAVDPLRLAAVAAAPDRVAHWQARLDEVRQDGAP